MDALEPGARSCLRQARLTVAEVIIHLLMTDMLCVIPCAIRKLNDCLVHVLMSNRKL